MRYTTHISIILATTVFATNAAMGQMAVENNMDNSQNTNMAYPQMTEETYVTGIPFDTYAEARTATNGNDTFQNRMRNKYQPQKYVTTDMGSSNYYFASDIRANNTAASLNKNSLTTENLISGRISNNDNMINLQGDVSGSSIASNVRPTYETQRDSKNSDTTQNIVSGRISDEQDHY